MTNTDYRLWRPTMNELRTSFGTLRRALNATQGNIPLACFLIHNPDRIDSSKPDPLEADAIYRREIMNAADDDEIAAAWHEQAGRKSVAHVMRRTNLGRVRCTKVLERLGLIDTTGRLKAAA